jgi:hypothetical protein
MPLRCMPVQRPLFVALVTLPWVSDLTREVRHAVPRLRFLLSKAGIEGEGNGVRSATLWARMLGLSNALASPCPPRMAPTMPMISAGVECPRDETPTWDCSWVPMMGNSDSAELWMLACSDGSPLSTRPRIPDSASSSAKVARNAK